MKKLGYIIALSLLITISANAQETSQPTRFNNLRSRSLISDYKAMEVGDAVKVLIVEETEAGNSAGTTESRNSSLSAGLGVGTGSTNTAIDGSISTGNGFKGTGANTRKESIRSQLTARVIDIDEYGNLIIEGKRNTKVDGETQTITLYGTIRPVDIRADNSIYSYNIMDLELSVEGDGNATKMQKPGLFTKFFRMLF
ncbi:MAG: flagellar basal body L-ring protein FlgH [Ignavibacteria bacterium]|jgi:flagellar L-ring protein precursor FlgH|nr:flagellar basal body L-ring protein FlgH [Ignavibacteria bacterium]